MLVKRGKTVSSLITEAQLNEMYWDYEESIVMMIGFEIVVDVMMMVMDFVVDFVDFVDFVVDYTTSNQTHPHHPSSPLQTHSTLAHSH